ARNTWGRSRAPIRLQSGSTCSRGRFPWAHSRSSKDKRMTMERETRTLAASLELRADADGKVVVEGYAAVFNEPTNIGDAFVEVIAPGAFRSAIERKDDVEFLVNHGGLPLARTTAGNLRLREDDRGLHIRAV